MNYNEILRKILRKYGVATDNIRQMQVIESKLKKHTASYADAEHYAQDIGRILTDVLREYLPEALTDGKLYRAAAEVLVQQPMITAGKDVAKVAGQIQEALNEEAGIGMKAIDPGLNQNQIDGIITGICNAESYDSYVELFMDQVAGFFEGEVDDFVRENADFQYKSGLSPTIERKISGKCCSWCAKLAGSYPYEDVKDRGNDVFRRHNNCHCQILYNPGNGSKRRQNVRSGQWTDEGKADRIAFAGSQQETKQLASHEVTNLRNEYVGRSVGAKAQNYDIMDLQTGEKFHLAEGTYLKNKEIFAGKGAKKPFEKADKFAARYGGKASDWQHVKGFGVVSTPDGDVEAEIHWSQCDGIGKKEMFIKKWGK